MPVYQGIVDRTGAVVRRQGNWTVVTRSTSSLVIKVPGQKMANAFVLATAWRNDGDIGPAGVSASPDPNAAAQMIFGVDQYYGVSFRIQT